MSKIEFRVTFGQKYRYEPHPTLPAAHPDGYLAVEAGDELAARIKTIQSIGRAWAFIYAPGDHGYPQPETYYPRGELGRLS